MDEADAPQFVEDDARTDERFRARTTLPLSKTNTLEKVLFNVGLIMEFTRDLVTWFNEKLPAGVRRQPSARS